MTKSCTGWFIKVDRLSFFTDFKTSKEALISHAAFYSARVLIIPISRWILPSARSWHYGRQTGLSDVMRFANLLLSWVSYFSDYLNSSLVYIKILYFVSLRVISNSSWSDIACLLSAKLRNFLLSEIFSSPKYRLWFHCFSVFLREVKEVELLISFVLRQNFQT